MNCKSSIQEEVFISTQKKKKRTIAIYWDSANYEQLHTCIFKNIRILVRHIDNAMIDIDQLTSSALINTYIER